MMPEQLDEEESKSKYHTPSFKRELFQNDLDSGLLDSSRRGRVRRQKHDKDLRIHSYRIDEQISFGDKISKDSNLLVLPHNKVYCKKCNDLKDYKVHGTKRAKDSIRFVLLFSILFFPLMPIGILIYCCSNKEVVINYQCSSCNSYTMKNN